MQKIFIAMLLGLRYVYDTETFSFSGVGNGYFKQNVKSKQYGLIMEIIMVMNQIYSPAKTNRVQSITICLMILCKRISRTGILAADKRS